MKIMQTNNKIGLGTAALGRPLYINLKKGESSADEFSLTNFKQEGIKILESAYNQGIRYFDTAPGYGMAEAMLMDWVDQKNDPSIEIATKWGYTYVANFKPDAIVHELKEHSLKKLNEQWETSKSMLPFLTTYQIHSATFETGVLENEEILYRLAELKNEFNLDIGITTTGANQIDVLKTALSIEVNGESLFSLFQVTYNIFDQSLSAVVGDIMARNAKIVIKEALANGRIFPNKRYPHYEQAYRTIKNLAQKYDVGIDAIALRFCMDSIPSYKVLSGASQQSHLIDNLKVNSFILDEKDLLALVNLKVLPDSYWQERKKLVWS